MANQASQHLEKVTDRVVERDVDNDAAQHAMSLLGTSVASSSVEQ